MTRLIRKPELKTITGMSYTAIWRLEKKGEFPQRVQLPINAVAWKSDEIEEWLQNRPRVAGNKSISN